MQRHSPLASPRRASAEPKPGADRRPHPHSTTTKGRTPKRLGAPPLPVPVSHRPTKHTQLCPEAENRQPDMKRTRAQQPKVEEPQDLAANLKPQRRDKQPRQPKSGAKAKPAAGPRVAAATTLAAAAAAAAAAANAASAASSPGPETAPTVPDVCVGGDKDGDADADASAVDWDLDAGLSAAAWWTWGVDEEKLLGWFPFVEEDFRCAGGGAAEVAAFDHDIWSIW
jgi:hypothetical protein